jgi:hypothetical protein
MRRKAVAGLLTALGLTACWGAATFSKQISPDERIQQALNRLTFGPRPGDAARVKAMGLKKWIDLQLHPDRIAENPELQAKLKALDSLGMTASEVVMKYPPPQVAQRMVSGQLPMPADPERQAEIRKIAERARQPQGQAPADLFTPVELRALRQGTAE